MKKIFAIVVILLFTPMLLSAQEEDFRKNELSFSYGGFSVLSSDYYHAGQGYDYSSIASFLGSREYVSEMVNIGVFGLSYHYYPLRWLAVGAKAAVTAGYIKTMDTFSYSESRFRPFSHSCVLAASVKFVDLNREWVRLYSEVSSGMGVTVSEKMVELNLVFNTVPFGVSVGKRFSGFAQIELGNVLCGMSIGVSYKF